MKGRRVFGENGKPDQYFLDGEEVTARRFAQAFPEQMIGTGEGLIGWKPILSDAMAVHPKQVKDAEADAKKKGVPTEFEKEFGRPLFTSRSHRRAYMKIYGVHDNSGGYGDG